MTYKKTWLSYLLWAVYTCLTGVMLANYAVLFWQKKINSVIDRGTVVFVLFVFVMVPVIYFLIRKIFGKVRERYDISSHTKVLLEIFIVLSLLCAGLLYRISLYLKNIVFLTENTYYQLATVKAEDIAEPMIHGASYLYTMCLSFVLSFLGNKMVAAVWLQILFQMVTVILAFFTVRRLAGRISACITMFVLAFSSVYAEKIMEMTPESLFFVLYLAGMFIVGGYVKNDCENRVRRSSAFWGALLSGCVIGILTYLDAVALTLFVLLFGLVTGCRQGKKEKRRNNGFSVLLLLTAAVAGGLTFIGLLTVNAYSYYEEIGALAEALAAFYRTHFIIDHVFYRTEYSVVECFILVILAAFLIMAFWNRRKVQNASPWIVLMLLLAPTPLTVQGVLPYQVYSVFIWGVLAGLGVQQSFVWERVAAKEQHTEEGAVFMQEQAFETVSVSEKDLPEESVPASGEIPAEKPRFLENPLPLPKKHEKRTMDYQYEVTEEQMKFDLEVNENDDFDIK